jgi:hypothetical protein
VKKSRAQINLAKLPAQCAARHPSSGKPILIVAGEVGFHPISPDDFDVEGFNNRSGVTHAQVEAMLIGSMFADPGKYPDAYRDDNEKRMLE